VDFHGEKRSNATHQSTTDPDERLARKGNGKEEPLSENRNGLAVNMVFQANATAEPDAALVMLEQLPGGYEVTVGADKGYDTRGFCAGMPESAGDAERGAKHGPKWRQRDRPADQAARRAIK
jgi:hypothetical protein